MSNLLKIGMIGLDTSHVVAFAKLLNDEQNAYHVPGGKVVAAFPGGSPDFALSINRVEGYTKQMQEDFGVKIVDSLEALAEESDAILLESVDGRVHLEQFQRIVSYGKPVFIDKPLAVSSEHANEIFRLAAEHNVPVMSTSSLRYSEALAEVLADDSKGGIIAADTYGPMAIEESQKGYFWYGIHSVEMLFKIMGAGCVHVTVETSEDHDVIVGRWNDGRIGTVRGNRKGNNQFGGVVHREKGSQFIDVSSNPKPYYASMLERIMLMFQGGKSDIDSHETLEVIRFIEAANESRETGKTVKL